MHDSCYCSLSKEGENRIRFLWERLYGNYNLRLMTLGGVKSIEQESRGTESKLNELKAEGAFLHHTYLLISQPERRPYLCRLYLL